MIGTTRAWWLNLIRPGRISPQVNRGFTVLSTIYRCEFSIQNKPKYALFSVTFVKFLNLRHLTDEEEGADTENVNFNEMVLDEEARKAVTSKRGSKSNEYSDRWVVSVY